MYDTIDPETGKQVIMYMSNPMTVSVQTNVTFNVINPIYDSKNSHKRTNKRKSKRTNKRKR